MSKHRVVKSEFWVDDYIETLSVEARYLFLYFLTCPESNILGIYKTTVRRICFETLLEQPEVEAYLKRFADDDKIHFIEGHILMVNFQRHQNPSGTMRVGITKIINELPKPVIDFIFSKKSRIYDRLYRGYLIDYVYHNKDIDIDKGKDKNINPVKNEAEFTKNLPEYITSKWSGDQIKSKTEDLIDYCKRTGKNYKDYYSALRNFLKKDHPDGQNENKGNFI